LCGQPLGCDGEGVENMMKNLGKEFGEEVQQNHVSGIGTEGNPKLRGSEEAYQMCEEFHTKVYPVESNKQPQFIATETGIKTVVNESRKHPMTNEEEVVCQEENF